MGIPILVGRGFQPSDDGIGASRLDCEPVVRPELVARPRSDWPHARNRQPVNRCRRRPRRRSYASVVEREPLPFYLLPLAQNYESGVTLHIRGRR